MYIFWSMTRRCTFQFVAFEWHHQMMIVCGYYFFAPFCSRKKIEITIVCLLLKMMMRCLYLLVIIGQNSFITSALIRLSGKCEFYHVEESWVPYFYFDIMKKTQCNILLWINGYKNQRCINIEEPKHFTSRYIFYST